ncbi:MAG TPA: phosphoglycerate kinase, partial [Candidatus Kapabacteria bacterium]|nr:phosphoglycerate kinase [Candidatus Kapabacteria bacterium]
MSIQSIKKIHTLHGRRVLIRVDFNVPLTDNLIQDDIRLRASLPTIKYLIQEGAKVILVTHLGRPEGKVVSLLSVDPIAIRLSELLRRHVQKVDSGGWGDTEYKNVQKAVEGMKSGDVVLLDNIRFSPEEEKNTVAFAKRLADLADLFVLDGFSVAHRAAASVSGVAALLPSYAGLLLEKELDGLSRVTKRPKKPFTLVLGGAKMETKIPVMDVLLPKATHVLIGGGIANTYLAAAGYGVGDSLVDDGQKDTALMFCKKKNVVLPV